MKQQKLIGSAKDYVHLVMLELEQRRIIFYLIVNQLGNEGGEISLKTYPTQFVEEEEG